MNCKENVMGNPCQTWISLLRKSVLLATILLLAISCGNKKKNKVKTTSGTPVGTAGAPVYAANDSGIINQVKGQTPCSMGRRNTDVTFYTSQSGPNTSRTTIQAASYTQGILGGNIGRVYVGVSNFGDVLVASKVTSGTQVVGYNLTFSMCNQVVNGLPLISNERGLSSLKTNGIIIDDDANCSVGQIDAGFTILQADPFPHPQYPSYSYPAVPIYTTFYKTRICP